jgi:site-specific DNA-methyltransferase (cytosine-N4-specific)
MSRATSHLPFGSEFSPSQIELPVLLKLAHQHPGNPQALEAAILARYFTKHSGSAAGEAAEYNRAKLANNCKLGMIAFGVIDRAANLTDFGQRLYAIRGNEAQLYKELARHILLNLNGLNFVQCILDMQAAGVKWTPNLGPGAKLELAVPSC